MPRIIDADKAIEYLENHKRVAKENNFMLAADEDAIIKFISEKCPTIDPDSLIPHGRWIEGKEIEEGTEIPMGVCSICGDSYNLEEFPFATLCDYFIYCPNCGAKMDKEG